jgi:hypothetical protein
MVRNASRVGRLDLPAGPVPRGSVWLCGLARPGRGGRCLAVRSDRPCGARWDARRLA